MLFDCGKFFYIRFRGTVCRNFILLNQGIQNIRREECRQRRSELDIFDSEIQQGQQDTDGFLFIPGYNE